LERRWYRLAIGAYYDKAIDFSQVSREDERSVVLESIILDEKERRLSAEYLKMFVAQTSAKPLTPAGKVDILDKAVAQYEVDVVPWLREKQDEKSKVKSTEDMYYTTVALARKQREIRQRKEAENG